MKIKNSPAYKQWASVFNLKQAAQTLIFLQEHGLEHYDALEKASSDAYQKVSSLSAKLKQSNHRLNDISELQKQISVYRRTRDAYVQYREGKLKSPTPDVLLHKAAKKYFDSLNLKKLPTINALKTEYAALSASKNKLYAEYRKANEEMKKLLTAKANVDHLLRNPQPKHAKSKTRNESKR